MSGPPLSLFSSVSDCHGKGVLSTLLNIIIIEGCINNEGCVYSSYNSLATQHVRKPLYLVHTVHRLTPAFLAAQLCTYICSIQNSS